MNHQPFPSLAWETYDQNNLRYISTLCRVKLKFHPTKQTGEWELRPDPEQGDLFGEDIFYSDNEEEVIFESDYIPYKPKADLILNAIARTPNNVPMPSWICGIKIVSQNNKVIIEKYLRVYGERYWRRQAITGIWHLDKEPLSCTQLPIRYGNSYGGKILITDEKGNQTALAREETNPIGCGLLHKKHPDKIVKAPQIEAIFDPITAPYTHLSPQGFGFIHRSWKSRLDKAGNYDEAWLNDHHPQLPHDFKPEFYQGSNSDMILDDYLMPNSMIELTNLLPGDSIQTFKLPNIEIISQFHFNTGIVEKEMNIDTVVIDIREDNETKWAVYISYRNRQLIEENIEKTIFVLKN
ncbi:MAG: DUF2169 domain-containing protein [Sulfuricurvum sp.]|nr:DUF2169 domain-containing protein [Sulfuricurvum sp.]